MDKKEIERLESDITWEYNKIEKAKIENGKNVIKTIGGATITGVGVMAAIFIIPDTYRTFFSNEPVTYVSNAVFQTKVFASTLAVFTTAGGAIGTGSCIHNIVNSTKKIVSSKKKIKKLELKKKMEEFNNEGR